MTLILKGAAIQAAPLRVVATTPDLASIAQSIGGERVEVQSLARGVQNAHFVEPKPSLIVKLMKADLFIQTGLEFEIGWAPPLIQGSRNARIRPGAAGFLDASAAVAPIDIPVNPTRAMGDVHPGGNPHYMADPENARLVARMIAGKLSELSPGSSGDFDANLKAFEAALDAKLKAWEGAMRAHKGTKFVGYHKDMAYFAKRFGLEPVGEVEPKPGIPPTAGHTAKLMETMKAGGVKLILTSPWYESRTPERIAKDTGAKVVVMTLFPGGAPAAKDYLAAVDYNIAMIVEALK